MMSFSVDTSNMTQATKKATQPADQNTGGAVIHGPCVLSGLLKGATPITFRDVNKWVVDGLNNNEKPYVTFRIPEGIGQDTATEAFNILGKVDKIEMAQTSSHRGWPEGTYKWLDVSVEIGDPHAWKKFATYYQQQMPWYDRHLFRQVTEISINAGSNKLVIPVEPQTGGLE